MGGEKYMKEPKLRFKADDRSDFPDWEEKKLEEVSNKIKVGFVGTCDCFYVEKHGVKLYRTGNLINGKLVDTDMKYVTRQFHEKNKKSQLKKWDILIARHGNSGHAVLYDSDEDANCLNIVIIQPNLDLVNPRFLTNNINSPVVEKQVYRLKGGSTQVVLNTTAIEKIKVSIPSLPEQQKIADFLSTIDTIIEKQQATVSAWEERKKGVMQKLFSQEVRFKADDGSDFPDWEEKSFVNTFDSLNNSTFSRDCLNYENGSVKYIHYGDILVKYNSSVDVCDAIVPFVNEDLDCERFAILQDGDIVIADTAEDDTVGKVIEIENTSNVKTIAGLHTIACRPKEKFASKYLGYYMNSDEYHNQLRPDMQGIKVTSISKSNIALTKIMVPSLPEQQKIADCLSALDAVIEKQKETLEKWQELKKGLLQQMFV